MDAILLLPFLFLSDRSEMGGGNVWAAGLICVKRGPSWITANYKGLRLQSVTAKRLLPHPEIKAVND